MRYRAPWWLPGAHLQTIYPSLFLRGRPPAYRRERWRTPDADFIELDWIDGPPQAPLAAMFHGLEGSSASHYATALMRAVAARRWRGVVVHFRGCGGEPNVLPRAYHSGDADEVAWILVRLRAMQGAVPLFATGVSLGGNAMLKWLGREGEAAAPIVDAAAAVSAPVDLPEAGDRLCRGINRLYGRHFLRTLKPKSLAKLARFPGLYDGERVARARDLRAFDDLVTAPLHGFRDAADYWRRSASKPGLAGIAVPTLIVHAGNDPFLPGRYLPPPAQVSPAVQIEMTRGGGHVGFTSGPFPGNVAWLPQRLLAFFAAAPVMRR
ncbi:MAG TPA: hydrolase [Burkholderiales bacterium]|jgi:predicted alpha/beta-fold hydrolase|nr:hydrolase [Burkholderiales bacterium]